MVQPSIIKASNDTVIIKVDNLNVRSGPSLDYSILTNLHKDEIYSFSEEKNGWYKIIVDNKEGWVAGWLVEPVLEANYSSVEANSANINVRSGPSTSFSILAQIQPETRYLLLDEKGEWLKIQLSTNKTGWVANWLVNITQETTSSITTHYDSAKINTDILNVRNGPSINDSIIGKLYMGDQIEIIEIKEGWYKINYEKSYGWIASEFTNKKPSEDETQPSQILSQKVVVQPSTLNLREGPGLEHNIINHLNKGDVLITDQSQNDWLHVTLENDSNINGWVASWLVIETDKVVSNEPTVTILNPGTNLREGPSTSYPVVAIANNGDQFPIIATEGDWYQLLLPNGEKAYVAGWIVSTKGIEKNIDHGISKLLENRVIVIDAGHGGKDYGATGVNFDTIEKTLNLSIALILQEKLEASGAKVIMTRTTDTYISLQQRVDTSIYSNTDTFISIHHNTNTDYSLNGTITYYYNTDDKKLANIIHNELVKHISLNDLKPRYGDYFVIRENPNPSIIIESAFISNYHDELKVNSTKYLENAAEGIFQGIIKYFSAE
ncbi:MAG: SH3 domain-containing protein [Vulcanibacillus sp.]